MRLNFTGKAPTLFEINPFRFMNKKRNPNAANFLKHDDNVIKYKVNIFVYNRDIVMKRVIHNRNKA